MKIKFLIYSCFFTLLTINISCYRTNINNFKTTAAQKQKYLSITYHFGDGTNLIYIGTNQKLLDSLYRAETSHLVEIFQPENFKGLDVRNVDFFILNDNDFNYIKEYTNGCKNDNLNKGWPSFYIDLYSGKGIRFQERKNIKEYFRGAVELLNKSSNRSNYETLINELQYYANI